MLRVAVRVRTTTRAVTLDDALKAAPLRRARDLHLFTDREDADVDDVTDLERRNLRILALRVIETERAEHLGRVIEPRLLRVPELRERRTTSARRPLALLRFATRALLPVAQLHRREAGLLLVRDGQHRIRR